LINKKRLANPTKGFLGIVFLKSPYLERKKQPNLDIVFL
jgi:hypothetical protein